MASGRHAFCSWCGSRFGSRDPWPRTCTHCRHVTFLNPLPVAVLVQPVDDGVLLIRRGEPGRGHGELALPGGFIERGETWQDACARELLEEANITIDPLTIEQFKVSSTPDGFLIVAGRAPMLRERDLPPFTPTAESLERVVIRTPQRLAFSMHEEVVREVLPKLVALPGETVLQFEVDHLKVRLGAPMHTVAQRTPPRQFKEVERIPVVTQAPHTTTLWFPGLQNDLADREGLGGPVVISVRRLRGVNTLDEVRSFFAHESGIVLGQEHLATREVAAGLVVHIDLGSAGVTSGNTFTFVISNRRPKETLSFGPTHWLQFDWSTLTIS